MKPKILVGNVDSQRDFIDVRDVVRAYWKLMSTGKYGEVYNIGSGKCRSIPGDTRLLQSQRAS
jgi:GDP-4-dehydro-6-deoxy-D-mannose reductase